jgi:hypothetical protein
MRPAHEPLAPGDRAATFLRFGYLPRMHDEIVRDLARARAEGQADGLGAQGPEALARLGAQRLREALGDLDGDRHVVPLSGGLDSRAILGALVAAGLRERIVAVTLGTPGTLDFEVGRRLARTAGVAHEAIDLTRVELHADALVAAARRGRGWTWAFDRFFHRLIPARFGPDAVYWSGFMGGALSGSQLPEAPVATWADALAHFERRNRFCAFGGLDRPGFASADVLPATPAVAAVELPYSDQLDFAVRQWGCIRPTVLVEGHDYRAPFLHPAWVRFILGVPDELRRGQRLYKRIIATAYPALFRVPGQHTLGLPLRTPGWLVAARRRGMKAQALLRARPLVPALRARPLPPPFALLNYLDFDAALRERADVRALVLDCVRALDQRGLTSWIRGEALWRRHQRRRGDFDSACALTLLASLELNLRAEG